MCAVIGARLINPKPRDFFILKQVFIESQVRGKHATGVAYVARNQVHIIKHPMPADAFPFDFPSYLNEDGNLYLIGHCRYSTSDLEYNQPIGDKDLAIVHNGVISQELPEKWKELYGHDCETKNDTELLFKTIKEGKKPWATVRPEASISMIQLRANKHIHWARNGKRPLWAGGDSNKNLWITSTEDIAVRAGLTGGLVSGIEFNRLISSAGIDLQP
jgi:glutamine phosphoribosylpyrophosphate amidotransferase